MPNKAFNSFVIILGFCLLGLPMILITLSTAPPGLDEFQSTINIQTVGGDAQSGIYLNNTASINGSSADYWDQVSALPELTSIHNLTELILNEEIFNASVNVDDYGGFSKLVHVFILDMTISLAPTNSVAKENSASLFGTDVGTFVSWKVGASQWNSSYYTEPNYPDINDTIDDVYLDYGVDLTYEVTINFYANIDINGVQSELEFVRLIYLTDLGEVLFFLTNEANWTAT
jgi:hypothetical protein